MKKIGTFLTALVFCFQLTSAQEVLTLAENATPATGNIQQLKWLTGYWVGTGLGGDCDELWTPGLDNTLHGIFRYAAEGTVAFSEFMIMEELNGTVTLKLKHFSKDLSPWEEKDKWVEFKLVKMEENIAYFDGITYALRDGQLVIRLELHEGDKTWIEEFKFTKTTL